VGGLRTHRRLHPSAVLLAGSLLLGACAPNDAGDMPAAPTTPGAPAEPAAPAPAPTPAPPAPDPLEALPAEVATTRAALLAAARATDWDAIGALIPTDVLFTFSYGGETDAVAYYEGLEEDVAARIVALLEGSFAQLGPIVVWPELHARTPFALDAQERAELAEEYGADEVAAWEQGGAYLGWRLGITDEGSWIFLVRGD
jgi:hypothetical protein